MLRDWVVPYPGSCCCWVSTTCCTKGQQFCLGLHFTLSNKKAREMSRCIVLNKEKWGKNKTWMKIQIHKVKNINPIQDMWHFPQSPSKKYWYFFTTFPNTYNYRFFLICITVGKMPCTCPQRKEGIKMQKKKSKYSVQKKETVLFSNFYY